MSATQEPDPLTPGPTHRPARRLTRLQQLTLNVWRHASAAVERQAIGHMVGDQEVPRVSGCWIVRATSRNRQLVGEHSNLFRNRFPGLGRAWSGSR